MLKIRIYTLIFLSLLFISCQEYLSINPYSSLEVNLENIEQVEELLTGAYPDASYATFLEPRTDNVAERTYGEQTQLAESMYYWEDYDQEDIDTPLNYWRACYKGIAHANKALELLSKYPKTPRVKALYGEAFLLRAYLHFMVVNIWSEPYRGEKSKFALGIPYVEEVEKYALVDYDRGNVWEVYEKIEQDLKRGISLVSDNYYKYPKFHFNKKAAYAFASRYYLYKGEWSLVIAYSDYVLGADMQEMLRPWLGYRKQLSYNYGQLYQPYTAQAEPSNLLLSTSESRIYRELPRQKYGLTTDLVDKIFASTGIEGCSEYKKISFDQIYPLVSSPNPIPNGVYLSKYDNLSLAKENVSQYRDTYVTNILLSADEVALNRIEALAMQKQYDRAVDELLVYMKSKYNVEPSCFREDFLSVSDSHYDTYAPYYGLTLKQLALIKIVTEFRQKEFIHEGLRWFDIRRFYIPINRKSSYTLYQPLRRDDKRKVLQIPMEAINRGLTPNPR